MSRPEFGVYLPQIQFDFETIVERVRAAERLGFDTVWFYDHFYPPGMPTARDLDGWTLVAALTGWTERIRLGQLVLCDAFRHPALLARQAISLDVISGGRLELGLGTGSNLQEFDEFGIDRRDAATRAEALDETCEVLKRFCTEASVDFEGRHVRLRGAPSALRPVQRPQPRLTIGGGGERRTLPLVARHADVWNCPTYALSELVAKRDAMRTACEAIGRDPASLVFGHQAVVVLAEDESRLAEAQSIATRRFGDAQWGIEHGGFVGTPERVAEQIAEKRALGFDQFVLFFHDRAEPRTLELFANEVIPRVA